MELFLLIIMVAFVLYLFISKITEKKNTIISEEENLTEQMEREERRKERKEGENREKEYERMKLLIEVGRQAKLVGEYTAIKAINNDSYDGPLPQEWDNECSYYNSIYPDRLLIINIAGINYRSGIASCVGDFNGVLLPDPKNDYDPHAIKIKNAANKFLGFIPEMQTDMVREFIGHPDADNDTKWRYRITGRIDQHEEYNLETGRNRKYYTGIINITKNRKES